MNIKLCSLDSVTVYTNLQKALQRLVDDSN